MAKFEHGTLFLIQQIKDLKEGRVVGSAANL